MSIIFFQLRLETDTTSMKLATATSNRAEHFQSQVCQIKESESHTRNDFTIQRTLRSRNVCDEESKNSKVILVICNVKP